ncbi:DUF3995 domain-containing protein [Natrononativus amylolyticus]|uniref:DUF3995 domain-containing protein n=1 Tax=Natrononativus amylolyticus TaxID=2963434 RepID=UPI0020CCA417|nr:DUF3995 domain-containing protein [Natrononativus amylolyticus]
MVDHPREDTVEEYRELLVVVAYLAGVWWFVFAAVSAYWAVGGTLGVSTLWGGTAELSGSRAPWIVTLLWGSSVLTFVLGVLSLAIVRPWGRYVPDEVRHASAFIVGLTLVPFVAVETLLRGVVLAGVLDPEVLTQTAVAWRLLFWNPWWVLGVLLYCVGAWIDSYTADQPATEPAADS